jgi:alanyl-tRNA synthetase
MGGRMTRLLYEVDPYLRTFDAEVCNVQGEWVALDRTAFFPGGGGQDADSGWISGLEVKSVRAQGEDVLHQVPGHRLAPGTRVECQIDWERRHDLMRGHTGEHLLFSILCKMHPEIELVKIAITPAKKSLIVKGELNWPLLAMAQTEANDAIAAQLPVSEVWASKDSEAVKEIRIKVERIHGDKVRIVRIGDIDRAACAGVHVQNTREIKMLLVTRLVSARPAGDFEIEFETGREAMGTAMRLSSIALQAADATGAQPDDLVGAIGNLSAEVRSRRELLKAYAKQALSRLEPEKVEGVRVYSGVFEGVDKKTLVDAVNGFVGEGRSAAVMASVDDRLMLVVATSKDLPVDCRLVLAEGLRLVGGKGGGGMNFASGGAADPSKAEVALSSALAALRSALK